VSARIVPADELVERALAASRYEDCVVIVEDASEAEIRFANNTTTTSGIRRDRRVSVVSMRAVGPGDDPRFAEVGTAVGSSTRSGDVDVVSLVRASEAEASTAPPAADAWPLVAAGPVDRDFAEPGPLTSVEAMAPVTAHLTGAFERARAAGHVLAGFATHGISTVHLGTSTGLRRRHVLPEGVVEMVARSADGTRSAWAGAGVDRVGDAPLADMEARLEQRLGWAQRKVELPAGRYEVVMPPDAVADLAVCLEWNLSGRDAEEGRNAFSRPGAAGETRVGDPLSAIPFVLSGDPEDPMLACAPFVVAGASSTDTSVFDNGLPIGATRWIDGGRLARLRYHRAGAGASGVEAAPRVGNLTLSVPGATTTLEEMVASTRRALLLTCLWYIRSVDPVTLLQTGLTRDGVYLVEDGEVVGAVNNFRFNESPLGMLQRCSEAGVTERALSREWSDYARRTAMPPLRVADFNMSSVSPAT
jgi:predicted Zn-dependent protease